MTGSPIEVAEPVYVTLATRSMHFGLAGHFGEAFKRKAHGKVTLLDSPLFPGCWGLEYLGHGWARNIPRTLP